MDINKIDALIDLLSGLKRCEWSKIAHVINRQYDSASSRLVLQDTESLRRHLDGELNGFSPRDYSSTI